MKDEFFQFLQRPVCETYLRVRAAVARSEHYNPWSDELDRADQLLDAGEFAQAREVLQQSMRNLLLSPAAHSLLAFIAEQTNDKRNAEYEGRLAVTFAEGILTTGEGTEEFPYLILRPSDIQDVIDYLGLEIISRESTRHGERHYERIQCTGETTIWFDVTDPHIWRERRSGT